MNKLLFLIGFTSIYSCKSIPEKEKAISNSVEINNSNIEDLLISNPDIYNISLEIDKQKDSTCFLYVSVELFDGAYFMSPLSNLTVDNSFSIEIDENEFISVESFVEEQPLTVPEYDSILNESINWVKENTTFKWKLFIQKNSDFEVSGKLQFRIYPKSNVEVIDYVISQQSGKLNIFQKGYDSKVPTKIMQIRTGATMKGYTP